MENKKAIERFIKKNKLLLLGCFLIVLLIGILLLYKFVAAQRDENGTIVTTELARESTIEGFQNPEDLAQYFLSAVQKKDMDKALRAFPIDERYISVEYLDILKSKGEFSYTMMTPPAGNYIEYQPMSSAQLTESYMNAYLACLQEFSDFTDVKIESIDVVYPRAQLKEVSGIEMQEFSSKWGAEASCEIMALVKCDDSYKVIGFTLAKYYGNWKLFELGAKSLEQTQDNFITEVTEENYHNIAGDVKVIDYITDLNKKILGDTNIESKDLVPEKIDKPQEQMLPPNYFVIAASFGKDEKSTISDFILWLQKKNGMMAMSYSTIDKKSGSVENTSEQILKNQADFSRQLTYFYYGLLGMEYQLDAKTFEEMEKSANKILNTLSPGQIPYMNTAIIVQMRDEEGAKTNQFVAVYTFNQKKYLSGYTLVQYDEGWQIDSLSSKLAGLQPGEVKVISDKQYAEWVRYDEKNN